MSAAVALLLTPENDKRTSLYRFPVPPAPAAQAGGAKGGRNKLQELELEGGFLIKGTNLISLETFEAMKTNPFFARCEKKGVIRVYMPVVPDGEKPTGTSADFALEDCQDIIEEASDIDWLNRCIAKDDRDGIPELCQERIKQVEEMEKSGEEQ
ncbi:hypothetical protein H6G00_01480 [Leptolyngbya sp. FACHB-541]|uniref:hypothetical protein n=1 Tax=Leptolyngbya sp. FACHB-541 TaxID=2692810 RepID=UPI001686BD3D|nr:hypothetical protein [Leptolyngbya sp. FACHB-541]MBD1995301.1 hypothetical protein [Leptolyngbya sp. FACHB-541]